MTRLVSTLAVFAAPFEASACTRLLRLTMPTNSPFCRIGTRLIRLRSRSAAMSASEVSSVAVVTFNALEMCNPEPALTARRARDRRSWSAFKPSGKITVLIGCA